ncbi:MAG: MBL fold metallo-hydrolase [Saprospiraceae bacterium]|nr:MBL fold metallo-hydrolase [Saprospiraceae bacterium]
MNAINKPGTVIISHNHGDHFGGAGNFGDLDFYAESEVAEQLNSTTDFTDLYSRKVIGVTGTQMIGDLTFAFDKVSNAETGENGYIYKVKHKIVFAEDLIYNLTHPYLERIYPK